MSLRKAIASVLCAALPLSFLPPPALASAAAVGRLPASDYAVVQAGRPAGPPRQAVGLPALGTPPGLFSFRPVLDGPLALAPAAAAPRPSASAARPVPVPAKFKAEPAAISQASALVRRIQGAGEKGAGVGGALDRSFELRRAEAPGAADPLVLVETARRSSLKTAPRSGRKTVARTAPPAAPARKSAPGHSGVLAKVVVGVSAVLFAAFIWHLGPLAIAAQLAAVGWRLPLVLLPFVISLLTDTASWWTVIPKPRGALAYRDLLGIMIACKPAGDIVPSYLMGEFAARLHFLRAHGLDAAAAMSSMVVSNATMAIAQVAFIVAGFCVVSASLPAAAALMPVVWSGLLATGLALGGLVWGMRRGLIAPALSAGRRFSFLRPWIDRFEKSLLKADGLMKNLLLKDPRAFWLSAAEALPGFLSAALEVWVIMLVLGAPVTFVTALMIEALLNVVEGLTEFIPGNLGAVEAGSVGIFAWLAVAPQTALAFALLRRFRRIAWTAIGLALMAYLTRSAKRVPLKSGGVV